MQKWRKAGQKNNVIEEQETVRQSSRYAKVYTENRQNFYNNKAVTKIGRTFNLLAMTNPSQHCAFHSIEYHSESE